MQVGLKTWQAFKGHFAQSYRRYQICKNETAAENVTPLSTKAGENTSKVLLQLFYPTEKHYFDLTGKFPVQSERGNNYILVAYHYDAKNILTTPIKNRTGPCILSGITKIDDKLIKQVLTPKIHIMDNEVSDDFKKFLRIQIYSSNWCHHICIGEMLHKGL